MFSKTTEYGLKAIVFIAQRSLQNEKTGAKEIAQNINAPEAYVAKILQQLVREEIVSSAKGPNGGFYLNNHAIHHLKLCKIVQAMEGEDYFNKCGLGLNKCNALKPCPIHEHYEPIRRQLYQLMEQQTLLDISKNLSQGKVYLK